MPATTLSNAIDNTLLGKRLVIQAGNADTLYQVQLPAGAAIGASNGDVIQFFVETLGAGSEVAFVASGATPVFSPMHAFKAGQSGRIFYTGTAWHVELSSVLGAAPPVVKPAPLTVLNFGSVSGPFIYGSSFDHNLHIRNTSGTPLQVTVAADSTWAGTLQYWQDDFSPAIDSPMPTGGSTIFTCASVGGSVTFVADSGVTIRSPASLILAATYGKATITKVGPNEWEIEGRLDP